MHFDLCFIDEYRKAIDNQGIATPQNMINNLALVVLFLRYFLLLINYGEDVYRCRDVGYRLWVYEHQEL